MATASDLANWWDEQHRDYHKLLEDFVDENPQWWGVGLATVASVPTGLGAGLVDVLRLGEGAAEGGVGGWGTDALRVLAIAGPLGRGLKYVAKGGQAGLARLVVDPGGGVCTWMSAAKAMRHVGAKVFATVDDLAKVVGRDVSRLGPVWSSELVAVLRQLGARIKTLGTPKSLTDVVKAASNTKDGVVLFAIKWTQRSGQPASHTIYAFKNALGKIRFADRTGHVVKAFSELERYYPGISSANVISTGTKAAMVLVEGVKMVNLQSGLAALVLPATKLWVVNEDEGDVEVIQQAFEARKAAHGGTPIKKLRPHRSHRGLPPVEHLRGVQARLNNLGYGAGPVDGIYGPKSKRAVTSFQKDYSLKVDGIPGPKTQGGLVDAHGS